MGAQPAAQFGQAEGLAYGVFARKGFSEVGGGNHRIITAAGYLTPF
jgi:hypothetical protein